jgi:serine/threonine protein kinase
METLSKITEVYQEYFFSKVACVFSQHFAKALGIDHEIKLANNEYSRPYLYIEILFEYGGESLHKLGKLSIDSVYNLMKQSANALTLLHSTGITHLDIKPANIVYNKDTDLLKVIDMGGSYGYGGSSVLYNPTISMQDKVREYTREFAPPELLQAEKAADLSGFKFIMGTVDVYCWAMCFYSILLNKTPSVLANEVTYYKLKTEANYDNFIKGMKASMSEIKVNEGIMKVKKDFIVKELGKALEYRPDKRPKMHEVVEEMNNFEREENIELAYNKVDAVNKKKLMKMLMIEGVYIESDITTKTELLKNLAIEIEKKSQLNETLDITIEKKKEERQIIGNY